MTRWIHTNQHCPRRPLFGRVNGRSYRCSCGRLWQYRITPGLLTTWRRWVLLETPTRTTP